MDINTMRLLADYNEKTNGEMNKLISHMDEAQWNHSFNAFFPNIRKICNHIYAGDFHWLRRFSKLRSFQYIQDEVFLNTIDFATDTFETQKEYLPKREYMDKLITDFVHEITQADLGRTLVYTDIRGTENHRDFRRISPPYVQPRDSSPGHDICLFGNARDTKRLQ